MQSYSRTDDLNPLSFGTVSDVNGANNNNNNNTSTDHEDDLLMDFAGIWGTEAASLPPPPPAPKPLVLGGGDSSLTQAESENTSTSFHQRHPSGSVISNVSSSEGLDDNASRNSLKRRRVLNSPDFPSLPRVREQDDDVRPWMVEVRDHDVVLGDTHEPTYGTKIYREVRKPYAKKTLDVAQLKLVKTEFQRRLEKDLGRKLECPPTFWANKEYTGKVKQSCQVAGYLKNRPGITYAYAKDQAIKDDIKNASARSRTRSTKVFNCQGSLPMAIERAMQTVEEWIGDDVDKELYARNFREDLKRMAPWHGMYMDKKQDCELKALAEPEFKSTHMRQARIHQTHASHLEIAMVEMINQMGNLMVESHRSCHKKSNGGGTVKSCGSVDESASYTSSNAPLSSRSKPPLGIRSVPDRYTNSRARGGISARPYRSVAAAIRRREEQEHGHGTVASSTLSGGAGSVDERVEEEDGNGSIDMEVSPISVRKAILTENLGQTFVMPTPAEVDKSTKKKELEVMFNTLRMGTGDDVPREVDQEAPDELSVLSMPDDVSVLLEARELAIRRGIDQPAALPRPGHVADRTKALLQQLGSKGNSKEGKTKEG